MSIPLVNMRSLDEMEAAVKKNMKRSKTRSSLLDLIQMLKEHHFPANSQHYRKYIVTMNEERMKRLIELEKLHKVRI